MLDFLRARAIEGVECGERERLSRVRWRSSIAASRTTGFVEVRRASRKAALAVTVSASLARVVPHVLPRVKHAFDLACDPVEIERATRGARGAHPGLRVPGAFDGFELAVRAIVGQQISVRAARTLLGADRSGRSERRSRRPIASAMAVPQRFADRRVFGGGHRPRGADRRRGPERCARWRRRSRAATSICVPAPTSKRTLASLRELPGIGPWTAQYIAMRALGWPDAFPANDLVVLRAMRETRPSRAMARSEAWRPWRAYAVMHLWKGH